MSHSHSPRTACKRETSIMFVSSWFRSASKRQRPTTRLAVEPLEARAANQLQPLLTEALTRWQASGMDTSGLNHLDIRIANLGGSTLGLASGHTIWLDDN